MRRLIFSFLALFLYSANAQVGINTTTPDASSMLDITATNKGVLVPRVSLNNVITTTLDGINTAATGLLIWNTNAGTIGGNGVGFYFFNGVQWMPIVQSSTNHNTLDQAYDQGGAGIGRTITADAGAVLIQGTDGIQSTGTFGSGTNLALSGAGTRMFFYPKKSAFRVGSVIGNEWNDANIGNYSTVIGNESTASGENSIAIGYDITTSGTDSYSLGRMNASSGNGSFTIGDNANSTHTNAFSIGAGTSSLNQYAFSLGYFTTASGENSFSIGNNNNVSGGFSFGYGNENTISGTGSFASGYQNNISGNESYALGRMTSVTGNGAFAIGDNASALQLSSYAIGNITTANGTNSFSIGNINTTSNDLAFAIGNDNVSSGANSFTFGSENNASGDESYAIGRQNASLGSGSFAFGDGAIANNISSYSIGSGNQALNQYAFALGHFNNSTGLNSFAFGNNNSTTGQYSFVIGNENQTLGNNSFALGYQNTTKSIFETALGTNNTEYIPVDATNFNGKDRLLVVGNGTDNLNKSDAFIMLKSGDTRLNGNFGIKRDAITNALEVEGDASKTVAGSWLANSDARLKKDVVTINPQEALHKILQLRGVNYQWNDDKTGKKRPEGTQTGFIAQEIQEVFPEKVSTDKQGYLQTAYGDYDPIIFQAIKALYEKIEKLEKENQELKLKLEKK